MIKIPSVVGMVLAPPTLFFTVEGNRSSEMAIAEIEKLLPDHPEAECRIFKDRESICFDEHTSAVALYDKTMTRKCFTATTRGRSDNHFPDWATQAYWGIKLNPNRMQTEARASDCARQTRAWFLRRFKKYLALGKFPWGEARRNEKLPEPFVLPRVEDILARLNDGPDLATAIAHTNHALELPLNSKISWVRVPQDPIVCSRDRFTEITGAMRDFEKSCSRLLVERPEIRRLVLSGVSLHGNPKLEDMYINPGTDCFSIARPDLHWTGDRGFFASENDEMPGGLPELVHLDHAYGFNQENWKQFFDWLFSEGIVVYVVSSEWSKPYITEITWLVEHLQKLRYPAYMVTTDDMGMLECSEKYVLYDGMPVGTLWRQFPIFETTGKLIDLVAAAQKGIVRMVPEWGHFGNKVWFSIYWKYHHFFQKDLPEKTCEILDVVLPDSALIQGKESFPITVGGRFIRNLSELISLPAENRNDLVLKICGANALSARSYGVLMGHGIKNEIWSEWLNHHVSERTPFIVQVKVETSIANVPVMHTKQQHPELFKCRLLMRPWVVNGVIVSAHCCAVPYTTLRVHGRVDMAIVPVIFE